jgi:methionyl-tRNA synthetase
VLSSTWKYLNEGLRDRAITRDINWGVKIPLPGFEEKRIYVWFEAVTGYLSASKEWAGLQGDETAWQQYWHNEAKGYYFIGKDNTFFHTLIWPAMLMGYGNLNLPYDVPANEFLTIEGSKLSTSRNWAVWLPDYLQRYAPDALRYFLTSNMPENADSDFSWEKFLRCNNNELVATYGNLVHRTLTFSYRNFKGTVPSAGELDEQDRKLLDVAEDTFNKVDEALGRCRFREALRFNMSLAQEANRYLDIQAPWKTIKENPEIAASTLFTVLCVLSVLRVTMYPFLPFSSDILHTYLGFSGNVKELGWAIQYPARGQKLEQPEALFTKLDESIVAEETARMGQMTGL